MALTNLTSCGLSEQDKLVDEKGVGMVYGLMCSDHAMVRRAATEVFCNMPLHAGLLKLMLAKDHIKVGDPPVLHTHIYPYQGR